MSTLTAPGFAPHAQGYAHTHLRRVQRAPAPIVLPPDVRLMRATANALLAIAFGLLLVLGANRLLQRGGFALRVVQVDGEVARNSAETIRANALPKLAGNFFTLDLAAARRAFESVPWVRQAVVHRVWPNRLKVELEEHRAVALWSEEGAGDKFVNSFGEVFEANLGDVPDGLPTLSGPAGSASHALALLQRLAPVLAGAGSPVDALAVSSRGSWRAGLANGAEIELGRGTDEELQTRAERFVATLPDVAQRFQRPLEYADLRHHDGYAVRLKGITTVAPGAAMPPVAKPLLARPQGGKPVVAKPQGPKPLAAKPPPAQPPVARPSN